MKVKLITIILLAAALIAAVIVRSASTIQKQPVPYKDRLKWYAKEAKSKGQRRVVVSAPLEEQLAGTISADEALSSSTVVVAHLLSKESYYRDDSITTWNKFAIDEVLSEAKGLLPGREPSPPLSSTLLPLQRAQLLIPKLGGVVNIDGVDVVQPVDSFPEYELNQKYLLLISLYPSGAARTLGGPIGVFKVLPNDRLAPIRDSEDKVRRDFKDKYGNSLEVLRKHLKQDQ